jgi:hypothetical protein
MMRKSRYFLVGSALVLLVGLGGGLVAYYTFSRTAGVPAGLPAELRYVPADAALVAYADVNSVMGSDLRREIERMTMGPRRGQQQMREFAGIDLEKDVHRIVAYLQADGAADNAGNAQAPPRGLVLAQGTFNQAAVEQFLKDHGGSLEDYHGRHILVRQMGRRAGGAEGRGRGRQDSQPAPDGPPAPRPAEDMALAFVQPDLIAVGPTNLVRRAIDLADSADVPNVTSDPDLMGLMRDASSGNAWVVGRFDAVSRRMGLPATVQQQVPPLRFVSASAHINGGVKATIKAQTADKAAADQLRDVVRGAMSFVRLQGASKPELQDTLKSIELSGTGNDVQLSFLMTPGTIRAIVPQRQPPSDVPAPPQQPRQ